LQLVTLTFWHSRAYVPAMANVSNPNLLSQLGTRVAPQDGAEGKTGYHNPDIPDAAALTALVEDVKHLYGCRPSDAIFARRYAPGATFEDPLGLVDPKLGFQGLAEISTPPAFTRFEVVDATRERVRLEVRTRAAAERGVGADWASGEAAHPRA
jgi:hypothetical protein